VRLLGGVWSEGGAVIRREEILHAVWFKSAERNHFCIGKNDRLHPLVFCSANAKSSIHAAPPTRPAQSCSASDMRHPEPLYPRQAPPRAALSPTRAAMSRFIPTGRFMTFFLPMGAAVDGVHYHAALQHVTPWPRWLLDASGRAPASSRGRPRHAQACARRLGR
jgi:hypothetical protein